MERLLEQAVPRYTSYPTTPHFTSAVGATTYMSWLAMLPVDATLSLYLHVPYCAQLCFYCGCHTKATLRRSPVDAYARRLIEEIALLSRYAGRREVVHIHWGGGTPSILGTDWLDRIAGALGNAFALGETREHAIELDPRRLTRPLAMALRDIAITRASLGVQEFTETFKATRPITPMRWSASVRRPSAGCRTDSSRTLPMWAATRERLHPGDSPP